MAAFLALALASCAGTRGPITYASAPMDEQGPITLDLMTLLAPDGGAATLEQALVGFPQDAAARNAVVGALMLASERNCDIYLENLRGAQTAWRTGAGLTSLALSTAGSIVTDSASARLLSGLAGASGSLSGRLDENLMSGMTADVILLGVRAGREPLRRTIAAKLTGNTTYSDWPIQIAIADVLQYHGRCNVVSGLAAAQRAVEREIDRSDPPPNQNQGQQP